MATDTHKLRELVQNSDFSTIVRSAMLILIDHCEIKWNNFDYFPWKDTEEFYVTSDHKDCTWIIKVECQTTDEGQCIYFHEEESFIPIREIIEENQDWRWLRIVI